MSSNYIFHNVIAVDVNFSALSYFEILIPVSPAIANAFGSYFIYVGYGIVTGNFMDGLSSIFIQELFSMAGISSYGPNLHTAIAPFY